MTLDPITGQGIGNAFRDAERLVEAIDSVFSGRSAFETAMAAYEQTRNVDTLPMYEFTAQIASFAPPSIEQQVMFSALARKPEAASEFFGALSGSVPLQEFFSSANVFRIIGPSGMGRVLFGKLTAARRPTSVIRQ